MSEGSVLTLAKFKGTLLMRKHTTGQKVVQLVFREGDKNWLCISSDPTLAKLDVGQRYHVEGLFKDLGDGRNYIHEPRITSVRSRLYGVKRLALSAVIVLVVAGMTAGAVRMVNGSLTPTSAETTQTQKQDNTKDTEVATAEPEQTEQTAPADTPATPAPTKPKTTTKKTTSAPTPTPTPTQNNASAVVQPAPHCDAKVVTTLTAVVNQDPAQPVGYEVITQQNIDREVQTCYPDVGNSNGTTKVLVEGQPQVKTVGTMDPNQPSQQ